MTNHECCYLEDAKKQGREQGRDLQPDLVEIANIAPPGAMDEWILSIEEYAFRIKACPFCGTKLAKVCRVEFGGLKDHRCQLDENHPGEHWAVCC
jgi:hypothetical protein